MIDIRGPSDAALDAVASALARYVDEHPQAQVTIYRQNQVSIRIRIVATDFQGIDHGMRHEKVWGYLEPLPEDVLGEIVTLLLLTPKEAQSSFGSFEFDNPLTSSR